MKALKKDREPQEFIKFLTYSFSYIALGVGVTSLGPLLPLLSANVGVSIGQINFIFTAQNIGYMIGSVIGGKLYDRIKSHRLMVAAEPPHNTPDFSIS